MLQSIRKNYTHTIYAGYIGYITQAIVNNFAPLLFLTFAREKGCVIEHLEMTRIKDSQDKGTISANIVLCFKEKMTYARIVEEYGALEGVVFLEML